MRPLANVLSKLATASAISDCAVDAITDDPDAKDLYQKMSDAAMQAMKSFPGQLSHKEISTIQSRLEQFFNRMGWDKKPKNAQTLVIFNTTQLEEIRSALVDHKADKSRINAIDNLIRTEVDLYDYFVIKSGKEFPLCNMAGINASDIWNKIWEGV